MLVNVRLNSFGHLEVTPVSRRVQKAMADHLSRMGQASTAIVYIQDEAAVEDFGQFIPRRKQRDLGHGWDVRVQMDPDEFDNLVGYDFGGRN